MRRLIFRPLVLIATFTVGLCATFLFTFAGDAVTQLFDDPSADIPALCRYTGAEGFDVCAQPRSRALEEFGVYITLLVAMYDGGHSDRILIRDHTSADNLEYKAIANPLEDLRRQIPLLQSETLASFRDANQQSYPLDDRLHLPGTIGWISEREIEDYFGEGGGGWQAFNRDHQNAGGFITLSRVGFNHNMNQALVYLASSCGETCGLGSLIFLVKEGGTWKIKGTSAVWIS